MKMARALFFLLFLLALVSFSIQSDDLVDPNSTDIPVSAPSLAHAELVNFGFPIGLLPSSVKGYNLNETSGVFSVDLGDLCKVTLPPDNYLASYSKKITGKIVKGRIHELDGIRVRALFQWWSITGIRSNGEDLVFEVGVVSAKYPSKNFNESPACEGRHTAS